MATGAKKPKTVFRCSDCDTDHNKWSGQCSGCGAWNTLEQQVNVTPSRNTPAGAGQSKVTTLDKISKKRIARLSTGLVEFDRVLGGGLVPGSTLVLGAAYTLWMVKRVIYGEVANDNVAALEDLNTREFIVLAILAGSVLLVGLWPAPLVDMMNVTVEHLVEQVGQSKL